MDALLLTAVAIAILFLSAFTRSVVGFGDALIAMPLLALLLNLKTVTPLVVMVATTIAITILVRARQKVELRFTWRLVVSSLAGIPFGLYFLHAVPESLVKGALGIVLIGFGAYNLIMPNLPALQDERWSYLFGFVAGVLGGAYNTNGPPVVVYGTLRKWSPEQFRATLQGYFLPTGGTILISHGLAGLWTPQLLRCYKLALPAVLAGVFIGGRLNRMLPVRRFQTMLHAFLAVIGGVLLI